MTDNVPSLPIACFANFRDLFARESPQLVTAENLAATVTKVGRVLIQGPSGIGKSHLSMRLGRLLAKSGQQVVSVQLSQLKDLAKYPDEPDEAVVGRFLAIHGEHLGRPTTFVIDDLDRLPPRAAEQILRAVEELTSVHPEWSMILVDGMIRRRIRESRWLLVGWTDGLGSRALEWAKLPFYLRIGGGDFVEPDDAIAAVFHTAGLDDSAVLRLARTVFDTRSSEYVDNVRVEDLDAGVLRLLERSNVLVFKQAARVTFQHALFADFLVGRLLAVTPALWTKDGFYGATYGGSRLESLNLALGQLPSDRVDEFVRLVDDWNYRASSALIAFDLENARAISSHLRLALLTLLGIRRFSRLDSVAGAGEDSLSLHGGDYAQRMLQAESLAEVSSIAASEADLAIRWPEFIRAVNVPRDNLSELSSYVSELAAQDEVLAWARSNMLACSLGLTEARPLLQPLVQSDDESIAWRAVHALASSREAETADLLVEVMKGRQSRWVKYGAIQSFLVVLDALEPDEAAQRAKRFFMAMEGLAGEPHFRRAVRRGLSLRSPSPAWREMALELIVVMMERSQGLAEYDEWLRASASIRLKGHL